MLERYRYPIILLKQLVKTDFKLRYQGSALGYLWSLLRPTMLFIILYVVFSVFLRVGDNIPNFAVYLLLGIVLWNFFAEATNSSVKSMVDRGDILRKINFPKYVIVLSVTFSAFINLFINLIVVFCFMLIANVDFRPEALLLPLIIIELFVIALAVAFYLSAVYVKFRDINYIWEVIMQGAFYGTPILYPVNIIPDIAAKILLLNPVAQIIQDIRYILITNQTITIDQVYGTQWIRLVPFGLTIGAAYFAASYFRHRSKYFAEEL